jgi:outer membrane autotransporter protein
MPEAALAFGPMVTKAPAAGTLDVIDRRWTVWGSAYGGRNRTDGDPIALGSHDLRANAAGFAGGADYRVSRDTVIGAAVAIGETRWNVAGLGKADANVAQVGGYASTRWNDLYLSAAVAGAWHRAATERTVTIAGADRLEADFSATSFGARAEAGWRFALAGLGAMPNLGVTPYAAVQVQSLRTPRYGARATTGSDAFALTYAAQTTTDTRSELGGWLDSRHALDSGAQLTLRARAAWVHDFDPGRRINAAFQTLPGASFTVAGAAAPRDAALTSAVAEMRLRNGVTLIGKFDGEFANRARTLAGTGTLRYAW